MTGSGDLLQSGRRLWLWLASAIFCAAATPAAADGPRVLASIPPLYSLVAAVTEGIVEPELLIPAGASPHNYALRPSDARKLAQAELLVWVGPGLEMPLARPIEGGSLRARVITLSDEPSLRHLRQRDPQSASHSATKASAFVDPHLWLDPYNAGVIVDILAKTLGEIDPARTERYGRNAIATKERLARLDGLLRQRFASVQDTTFLTFHDAYQYLEARYGLRNLGFVVQHPEHPTAGARHLVLMRDRMEKYRARCVFTEPEYDPYLVRPMIEGTTVRVGVLDHLGSELPLGGDGYFLLMEQLSSSLVTCLTAASD